MGGLPATDGKGSARQRSRNLQAQQRERDRRRRLIAAVGASGVVAAVIVAIVVVAVLSRHKDKNVTVVAPPSVVAAVTSVPAANFDAVGGVTGVGGIKAISGQTPLTSGGKPEVLYVGGEFCPFCAAERWPLAVALSRFGSFSGLDVTRSGSNDGNYATLSFVDAKYTSDYVDFVGKEIEDRQGKPLETLTEAENSLASTLGPTKGRINFPFIDFGNRFVLSGAQYNPAILGSLSADQIAESLGNPSTDIGKAVLAAANNTTAAICALTNGQPSKVCGSSGVAAASRAMQLGQ